MREPDQPKPTPQETLERIAGAVWIGEEEANDDFFEFDRETLLGMIADVRWALHDAGIKHED